MEDADFPNSPPMTVTDGLVEDESLPVDSLVSADAFAAELRALHKFANERVPISAVGESDNDEADRLAYRSGDRSRAT